MIARITSFLSLVAALAVAGPASSAPSKPSSPVGTLPATFTGLLPCADCIGLRYQINLLPNGAYMQKTTYLRDGHDDSFYEVGAWTSSDGRTLTLDGGRNESAAWVVIDARTLRKLDSAGRPIESALPYELKRSPALEPMAPRLKLRGTFRLTGDEPRFRDCRSGLVWPVSTGNDYRTAADAYAVKGSGAGSELLMWIQGRIEPLPETRGKERESALVVEKFVSAMPGESCAEGDDHSNLVHNRWRPIRIGSRTVTVAANQQEPWIVLDPKTHHVTGSGGCNRMNGSYETGAGTLRFGTLAMTRMACPSMETESAFVKALEATRGYRVSGRVLELLDAKGTVLARLEERNL